MLKYKIKTYAEIQNRLYRDIQQKQIQHIKTYAEIQNKMYAEIQNKNVC